MKSLNEDSRRVVSRIGAIMTIAFEGKSWVHETPQSTIRYLETSGFISWGNGAGYELTEKGWDLVALLAEVMP